LLWQLDRLGDYLALGLTRGRGDKPAIIGELLAAHARAV